MKVQLPKTSDPVLRALFKMPGAEVAFDMVQASDNEAESTLPDGIAEDDVEVSYVGIGAKGLPVGPEVLLKPAVLAPPADPPVDPPAPPADPPADPQVVVGVDVMQ